MTATCTNIECQNYDVAMDVPDDTDMVVCGPCGTILYDRTETA